MGFIAYRLKRRHLNLGLGWLFIGGFFLVLIGCSAIGEKLGIDTKLELAFEVENKINLDDRGRASPLVVRVYQLKDYRQFDAEDFLGLYEADTDRLGPDLINKQLLQELTPGHSRTDSLVLDDSTQYIGLMGEFVQYDEVVFRLVLPVKAHQTNRQTIVVDQTGLSLPSQGNSAATGKSSPGRY